MKIKFLNFSYLERGSDERQYNWPGIDLPIASITRSKYGNYKEYHTSLDDLNFISSKGLNSSYNFYVKLFRNIEKERLPISRTKCEPFLQKINIYPSNVVYKKQVQGNKKYSKFFNIQQWKNEINFIAKKLNLNSRNCLKVLKLVSKYKLAQLI